MSKFILDDGPAAFAYLGVVPEDRQQALTVLLEDCQRRLADQWKANAARGETFWVNLWQRSDGNAPMDLADLPDFDLWANDLLKWAFPDADAICDGYGFIINPVGSKAQDWHIDYTLDYATVFIPMTGLTTNNATQYAILPPNTPPEHLAKFMTNLDVIDMDDLTKSCGPISVRQMLAPPFSILRMDYGTIHRAVANSGPIDRVMLWISANRSTRPLPVEPAICNIPNYPR